MKVDSQFVVFIVTFACIAIMIFVYDLIFGIWAFVTKKYTLTTGGKYTPLKVHDFTGNSAIIVGITRIVRGLICLSFAIISLMMLKSGQIEQGMISVIFFLILIIVNSLINKVLLKKLLKK